MGENLLFFFFFRSNQEEYLTSETRNNVQLLINKLFELPMRNEDGYMYVDLPEPRYNLPREKPLPTPKPLTKWQKFAIEKGIKKTPKPKTTWDDILQVFITNDSVCVICVYLFVSVLIFLTIFF